MIRSAAGSAGGESDEKRATEASKYQGQSAPMATRFAPGTTQLQIPPEMAAVMLRVLYSHGHKVRGYMKIFKRVVGSKVLNMVQNGARSARAMATAHAKGLAVEATTESEVRNFLSQSWELIAWAAAGQRDEKEMPRRLHRAATLYGELLRAVPEEEARTGFQKVLQEWAGSMRPSLRPIVEELTVLKADRPQPFSPSRRDAERSPTGSSGRHPTLDQLLSALRSRQPTTPKARFDIASQILKFLQSPKGSDLTLEPKLVLEAIVAVAKHVAVLTNDAAKILHQYLMCLEVEQLQTAGLWRCLEFSPARLRTTFLSELAKHGTEMWWRCEVSPAAVAKACADFLAEQLDLHSSKSPKADTLLHPSRTDSEVVTLLQALSSSGCLGRGVGDLIIADTLLLCRLYPEVMQSAGAEAFTKLVACIGMDPGKYRPLDMVAIATALPETTPKHQWRQLAGAFMTSMASQTPGKLVQVLLGLPGSFRGGPRAFDDALEFRCQEPENGELLTVLTPEYLLHLIDVWATRANPVPTVLLSLLLPAISHHARSMDLRRLLAASKMLSADARLNADVALLKCWTIWMESTVGTCKVIGWGRCQEALRECHRWSVLAEEKGASPWLAAIVFHEVIIHQLLEAGHSVPFDVLLGLVRLMTPDEPKRAKILPLLEERISKSLKGEGETISLLTAIAIASRETPIVCEPGSPRWEAITICIASKLQRTSDLDLFVRSQPSPELRRSVAEAVGGWQALELQFRLPC